MTSPSKRGGRRWISSTALLVVLLCRRSSPHHAPRFAVADAFPSVIVGRGGKTVRRPPLTAPPRAERLFRVAIPLPSTRGGGGAVGASSPLNLSPSDSVTTAAAVVFDNLPLYQSLGMICATNVVGFILSLATGSFLHVDLLGAGAFGLATIPALMGKGAALTRVKVSSVAVVLWSAKLAAFLFFRAIKAGHDARVSGLLETLGGTVTFWISSAIWGVLCSLPHTLGTTSSMPGHPAFLGAGTALFVAGLIVETLADFQKWSFKASNPGKFCDVGLWSVSQHPNFFGNLLLWGGILVMNAPALIESAPPEAGAGGIGGIWAAIWGCRRLVLATLSWMAMCGWFLGQADGTLTPAVELSKKRYGDDPAFVDYIEKVPLIVPRLLGRGG